MPTPIADDFPFINQRMQELGLATTATKWAVWFEPAQMWVRLKPGGGSKIVCVSELPPTLFNSVAEATAAIDQAIDAEALRGATTIKLYPDTPS